MVVSEEQYLEHFGIKGMKWGKRKAKPKYAEGYSERQRKQDESMYGKRGMKRINRDIKKGNSVKGARSKEVKRQSSPRRRLAIEAGKWVAGNAAYAAGARVGNKILSSAVGKGKISAVTAQTIARGTNTVARILNIYQGYKVNVLGLKSVMGIPVQRGDKY